MLKQSLVFSQLFLNFTLSHATFVGIDYLYNIWATALLAKFCISTLRRRYIEFSVSVIIVIERL